MPDGTGREVVPGVHRKQVADVFDVPNVRNPGIADPVVPTEAERPMVVAEGDTVPGHSADRTVEVTIDARGVLCDLRIDPKAFRSPHPGLLGRLVVEAVADGRTRMLRAARERRA
jgi:hypothetical protein